ncbi:MAG: hypothetical protein R3B70_38315 [Polyangiaceae bacterium]
MKEHDAGKDSAGRTLSATLFFTGFEGREDPDQLDEAEDGDSTDTPRPQTPAERDTAVTFRPDGEDFGLSGYGSCNRYEYWRVVREADAIVQVDRLTSICNDGHGMSGVGEDVVTIGPNAIEISSSGGSSWRWGGTTRYSLSPFQRLSESSDGYWTMANNHTASTLDYATFSGTTKWSAPLCDAGSAPNASDEPSDPDYEHLWIPTLPLDPALTTGAWKTTSLAECATRVDATAKPGYLLSGTPGTPEDGRMRVVATPDGVVLIEIDDDKIVGPTARPETTDHLEVWTGIAPSWDDTCISVDPADRVMRSWNVRLSDGKVTAGHGKPPVQDLAIERIADPSGTIRFRLQVDPVRGLTLVHADNDDGSKLERRVATSLLVEGHPETLGRIASPTDIFACVAKSGVLTREMRIEPFEQDPPLTEDR